MDASTSESANHSTALIIDYCTQQASDSNAEFKEKGHFMRHVLELAKRTRDESGKPLISSAEADRIIAAIPLNRGRTR